MLNHELYRFLYPTEPFLNFIHEEPLSYMSNFITRLCETGLKLLSTFSGYPESNLFNSTHKEEKQIEQKTSDLYTPLWAGYSEEIYLSESKSFILKRLKQNVIDEWVKGKKVLDLGCGSGRNSLALSMLGAREVVGMDYHKQSYKKAEEIAKTKKLGVKFVEGNALSLPFEDNEFDFVYSNGVLHHTQNWHQALSEYFRVMNEAGFIYLYATGGFFWKTRKVQREIFSKIPQDYTLNVLHMLGMPTNRMIFMDVWYVPIEDHIHKAELESIFKLNTKSFKKLISTNTIDLDYGIQKYPTGQKVWGEGEHRYLLIK